MIGPKEHADGLVMHYFDSRGVQRLYELELRDRTWTMARDAPGFSQRFTGTIAADGATIDGLWTLSRDGATWDDDLRIAYERRSGEPHGEAGAAQPL